MPYTKGAGVLGGGNADARTEASKSSIPTSPPLFPPLFFRCYLAVFVAVISLFAARYYGKNGSVRNDLPKIATNCFRAGQREHPLIRSADAGRGAARHGRGAAPSQ